MPPRSRHRSGPHHDAQPHPPHGVHGDHGAHGEALPLAHRPANRRGRNHHNPRAEVGGQFALSGRSKARMDRLLDELGLPPCEDGALVVRRVISRAGRHKQFVNGALATVTQLKDVAEPLVDITGQHAHQALQRVRVDANVLLISTERRVANPLPCGGGLSVNE